MSSYLLNYANDDHFKDCFPCSEQNPKANLQKYHSCKSVILQIWYGLLIFQECLNWRKVNMLKKKKDIQLTTRYK
jgi:hypothetical protein